MRHILTGNDIMATSDTAHLQHEALVGGVSNAFFNGFIAWLLLRNGPALAWGGEHSFAVDPVHACGKAWA